VNPEVGTGIEFVPLWIAALVAGTVFAMIRFNVAW
jgi:hypothetical protein